LKVPKLALINASTFLDSVQKDGGASYGYTAPDVGVAATAIGLLERVQEGWMRDEPNLERGVKGIATHGPSKSNFYYNYFATSVLFHRQGDVWQKWNHRLRDHLVASQVAEGHAAGSWHEHELAGGGADRGGRLYCTSLSILMLESCYRLGVPLQAEQ
jgi:hypothetical protein